MPSLISHNAVNKTHQQSATHKNYKLATINSRGVVNGPARSQTSRVTMQEHVLIYDLV